MVRIHLKHLFAFALLAGKPPVGTVNSQGWQYN